MASSSTCCHNTKQVLPAARRTVSKPSRDQRGPTSKRRMCSAEHLLGVKSAHWGRRGWQGLRGYMSSAQGETVGTGDDGVRVRRPAAAAVHDHVAVSLLPGDRAADGAVADVSARAIVTADGQQPVPSSCEHASASAGRTRPSSRDAGELAQTQFITAMLIVPAFPRGRGRWQRARLRASTSSFRPRPGRGCPILGAEWERTASVSLPRARPAGPGRGG